MSKKLYRPEQPRLITNQQNAKTAAATGEALFKAAGTQFLANLLLAGYRLSNPAGEDITEELLKELAPPEPEGEADHVAKRLHVVGAKPEPGKEAA